LFVSALISLYKESLFLSARDKRIDILETATLRPFTILTQYKYKGVNSHKIKALKVLTICIRFT